MGPAGFFAPEYLRVVLGWPPATVALLSFFGGMIAIVGNPAAGWLSDRHGRRPMASLVAVSFALLALAARSAAAGDLEVTVTGFEPGGGAVRVGVFASGPDFEAGLRARGVEIAAEGQSVRALIRDLPPGFYGIAAYQDADGDDELSKNFMGIPKERYGFSNGARGRFGPPDFEAMRVQVAEERVRLEISIE